METNSILIFAFWVLATLLFVSFGLIVLTGAPYVPTRQKDLNEIFHRLKLKSGDIVLDMGSGDGRVLLAAAQQGYQAVGYELNIFLWLLSKLRLHKYHKLVQINLKSLWQADLSKANAVFIFTAQPFVKRLNKKFLKELKPDSYVISYGFELPDRKPTKKIGAALVYQF